jgi:formiminotetrahydrofolate cyclodeaminase
MVVAYTSGKKNFEAHQAELDRAAQTLIRARELMIELAAEDERAYADLNALLKLPEHDPKRLAEMPIVTRAAIQAPMAVMGACVDLLRLFHRLSAVTNPRLRSDLAIAGVLAEGVVRASLWNVEINLSLLSSDADRAEVRSTTAAMTSEGARLLPLIESACRV